MRQNMWRMGALFLFAIFAFARFGWCMEFEGTCRGRVIDAETGKPMQGVVVMGIWSRFLPTVGGNVHTFYDAKEVLTDEKGEFSIPGMGFPKLMGVEPMDVIIFKCGYEVITRIPWTSFREGRIHQVIVEWEGDRAIIHLKRLILDEKRRWRSYPSLDSDVPDEKQTLMQQEINKVLHHLCSQAS